MANRKLVTRTLKECGEGDYCATCPTCAAPIQLRRDLTVLVRCSHFVRRWRVAADARVRVEFHAGAAEPAGAM